MPRIVPQGLLACKHMLQQAVLRIDTVVQPLDEEIMSLLSPERRSLAYQLEQTCNGVVGCLHKPLHVLQSAVPTHLTLHVLSVEACHRIGCSLPATSTRSVLEPRLLPPRGADKAARRKAGAQGCTATAAVMTACLLTVHASDSRLLCIHANLQHSS